MRTNEPAVDPVPGQQGVFRVEFLVVMEDGDRIADLSWPEVKKRQAAAAREFGLNFIKEAS